MRCFHQCDLRQNLLHDAPLRVGQPELATAVAIGELLVVETEQVQDRGVEIVDRHLARYRFGADLIGRTVTIAGLHAAAGEPHGEAADIVIATAGKLRVRRTTELATPHDQRLVEHAALLEIGQERGDPSKQNLRYFELSREAAERHLNEGEKR